MADEQTCRTHPVSVVFSLHPFLGHYRRVSLLLTATIQPILQGQLKKWTTKIIHLVEIIYALDTVKCVDSGSLKEERLKAGLTQEQLAQKIGTAELNKISSALRSFLVKGLYLLPNNTYICLNKVNESM